MIRISPTASASTTVTPDRQAPFARWLLLALLAGCAGNVGAEEYLPAIGGNGGSQFKQPCAGNENLTGFELRAGDDIDAIRPVCVVSSGPSAISAPALTEGSGLIQGPSPFEPPHLAPGWFGGPGGHIERVLCPANTPIVLGMDVAAEGLDTITVNNIHLFCGQAIAEQTPSSYPSAVFDAPGARPDNGTFGIGSRDPHVVTGAERCPDGEVAIGAHGRTGIWVDAIGLICDAPRATHYMALGRVQSTTPGPHRSLCDQAADAQARNSPAAPALQAQCEASRRAAPPPASPVAAMSRVNIGSSRDAFRAPKSAVLAPAQGAPPPAQGGQQPFAPVPAPNDLIVGRIGFEQNNRQVRRVRVGVPVAIACTYNVQAAQNPFEHIHPWQGAVQIGGGAPQTLPFQGNTEPGQYVGRVTWTPTVPGAVPVGCVLNPDFSNQEADGANNRTDEAIMVLQGPQPGAP